MYLLIQLYNGLRMSSTTVTTVLYVIPVIPIVAQRPCSPAAVSSLVHGCSGM